ncbi:Uncharacterised protein [Mycobacterium tuberculosis]|nr:Uncharacterised protein [Mycobacterium tuberculosis]
MDCFEEDFSIFQCFSHWFFDIDIFTAPNSFGSHQGMLKICSTDYDSINVTRSIKFIIVAVFSDTQVGFLFNIGFSFIAAAVPDVRHGNEFKVEVFGMVHKRWYQRVFEAI